MKNSTPRLSVLVSLVDHREEAAPCIDALTNGQEAEESDFEVIVISDGSEPEIDREISLALREQDRFLIEPTPNEYRLFNVGAEFVRAEVIIVIESHCVADSRFVSTFIEEFQNPDIQAARCRSIGVAKSELENFEREMFEDSFAAGLRKGSWNRVLIHGFGIRRELFSELGGFREESENFGPWELGARLHQRGVVIAYLEEAVVHHRYMGNEEDLRSFIVRFSRAEWEYLVTGDRELIRQYFPRVPEWESQGQSSGVQARKVLRSKAAQKALLRQALCGPVPDFAQTVCLAWRRIFSFGRLRERVLLKASEAAWARAAASENRDDFVRFWRRCVDLGRWIAQTDYQAHVYQRVCSGETLHARDMDPRSLYGWQALHDSESHRWTEPLAVVSLNIETEADALILDLIREPHGKPIFLYLGGYRIEESFFDGTGRRLRFRFPDSISGNHVMALLSPMVIEEETGNPLGLAVESIQLEKHPSV